MPLVWEAPFWYKKRWWEGGSLQLIKMVAVSWVLAQVVVRLVGEVQQTARVRVWLESCAFVGCRGIWQDWSGIDRLRW